VADDPHSARAYRVIHHPELGSTNTEALSLAARGETGPLWVVTDRQTQGRGRSGRTWTSVDGNFYGSLLVTLDCPTRVVHQLSLLAGVAVHGAVAAAAARAGAGVPALRLKWPNDVLMGEAKIAGILPESTSGQGGQTAVVIGIGLNLAGVPDGLGRAAACLADAGVPVTPTAMLDDLHSAFRETLALWDCGRGFRAIRERWLARAGRIGEAITVNAGGGPVAGTFGGVDPDGALLLREPDGALRRFTYGDVSLSARGTG
jgi:BirA family biotin operon repressor/biotin-[acetyl-CoA-carboxylase] ligase